MLPASAASLLQGLQDVHSPPPELFDGVLILLEMYSSFPSSLQSSLLPIVQELSMIFIRNIGSPAQLHDLGVPLDYYDSDYTPMFNGSLIVGDSFIVTDSNCESEWCEDTSRAHSTWNLLSSTDLTLPRSSHAGRDR